MTEVFNIFKVLDFEDYYNTGEMLISTCPVHEGDNQSAFNINIDPSSKHYGLWFCNTAGCHKKGNDILSLLKHLLDNKYNRQHTFGEVLSFAARMTKDTVVDPVIKRQKKDLVKKKGPSREIVRSNLVFPAKPFLDRGFTKEALDFFDVGVCTNPDAQMYNRVVFPIYDEDDEHMVGCVGRTISPNYAKWRNLKGFNKANHLYNYAKSLSHIKRLRCVVLVEGQGDVIRMWEAGIYNCVGMFGSHLSDAQEFLLQKSGATTLIVISDNDAAGEKCRKDIHERLGLSYLIVDIIPDSDVGDMSVSEISQKIKPKIRGMF